MCAIWVFSQCGPTKTGSEGTKTQMAASFYLVVRGMTKGGAPDKSIRLYARVTALARSGHKSIVLDPGPCGQRTFGRYVRQSQIHPAALSLAPRLPREMHELPRRIGQAATCNRAKHIYDTASRRVAEALSPRSGFHLIRLPGVAHRLSQGRTFASRHTDHTAR